MMWNFGEKKNYPSHLVRWGIVGPWWKSALSGWHQKFNRDFFFPKFHIWQNFHNSISSYMKLLIMRHWWRPALCGLTLIPSGDFPCPKIYLIKFSWRWSAVIVPLLALGRGLHTPYDLKNVMGVYISQVPSLVKFFMKIRPLVMMLLGEELYH